MITKINELAKLGDAIAISKSEGSLVKDQTFYGFFLCTFPILSCSHQLQSRQFYKNIFHLLCLWASAEIL